MKIKYTYYICRCGRRVIPLTNSANVHTVAALPVLDKEVLI